MIRWSTPLLASAEMKQWRKTCQPFSTLHFDTRKARWK